MAMTLGASTLGTLADRSGLCTDLTWHDPRHLAWKIISDETDKDTGTQV